MGLTVTGTIGVLLRAKQASVITDVVPVLDALDAVDFRVSQELRAEALRLAGEMDSTR